MDYFYLKLGRGNELLGKWLSGKHPAAPIYFDNLDEKDYASGKGDKEPREFVRRGEPELHDKTLMVVVHSGSVWILRPAGRVKFLESEPDENGNPHTPKVMPVEVLKQCVPCKDVPPVLAGIGANQFFARGTFRRVNDWGNFKAIDSVLGRVGKGEHWDLKQNGPDQLLECLNSTEMETLVAKLLEAKGCFVPAHRGGVMKDIDLFAHNDGAETIKVGPVSIPALKKKNNISVQVKRWADGMECPAGVDLLVGIGVKGPRTLNAEQLLALVHECPPVERWLRRSLSWLPESLLAKFNL